MNKKLVFLLLLFIIIISIGVAYFSVIIIETKGIAPAPEKVLVPKEDFKIEPSIEFRSYDNINDLLADCPTAEEIRQIENDFNLIWKFTPDKYECTNGGSESNHQLTVYNVFRTYKALPAKEFKWMGNYDNAYDWLKSLNLEIHLKNSGTSAGGGDKIFININSWNGEYRRVEYIPRYGNGFPWTLTIFMHEARHTKAGGEKFHTCGEIDQTLAELGAFGVHYQWQQHLANSGFFSNEVKPKILFSARLTLEKRLCE